MKYASTILLAGLLIGSNLFWLMRYPLTSAGSDKGTGPPTGATALSDKGLAKDHGSTVITATPVPIAASETSEKRSWERHLREMFESEAGLKLMALRQRTAVRTVYRRLLCRLQLSPLERDRLLDLLAERAAVRIAFTSTASNAENQRAGITGDSMVEAEYQRSIAARLSSEDARILSDFDEMADQYQLATPLLEQLDAAGVAATPAQETALALVLRSANWAHQITQPDLQGSLPATVRVIGVDLEKSDARFAPVQIQLIQQDLMREITANSLRNQLNANK